MNSAFMELIVRHWPTLHGLVVLSGLAVYVIASHTLHQRRHPSAAIAWVVALVLLPYLALPLYLIFGNRKVVHARARAEIHDQQTAGLDSTLLSARTRQLAAAMALPAASPYSHLNIHDDGRQALHVLTSMIDGATRTLDVCTFVFGRDALGNEIARKLMRKAGDGVRVRLLVDGVGAFLGGRPDFKGMVAAGVEVAFFVPPLRSPLQGRINLRNHRKMLLKDSESLWCGGRNLASEYFTGDATQDRAKMPWIDLSFDLRGELAVQAQQQFDSDWAFARTATRPAMPPQREREYPSTAALGQLIASGPDQVDDTLYALLISAFFGSRKRIIAVTPYFVPDPMLLMSLTLAARRGVVIDLLLPESSNHRLADLARHRALRELVSAGAHVRFLPWMIHAKAIVIDDELAFVGSANLDQRSLFLNYELMLAFYAPTDVERFARWIDAQQKSARPYQAQPPALWLEIVEGLFLWLAFQL
jgi:cardiolipin synthase A/B